VGNQIAVNLRHSLRFPGNCFRQTRTPPEIWQEARNGQGSFCSTEPVRNIGHDPYIGVIDFQCLKPLAVETISLIVQ